MEKRKEGGSMKEDLKEEELRAVPIESAIIILETARQRLLEEQILIKVEKKKEDDIETDRAQ